LHNFIPFFIKILAIAKSMRAMYKGAILGMLSITAVFAGFTLAMNPDLEESPYNDSARIVGHMILTVTDENDNVIAFRESDNTIVTLGMNTLGGTTFSAGTGGIPGLGVVTGPVTHMDIGSDGTAPAPLDAAITALGGTCVRDPSAITSPFVGVNLGGNSEVIITATSVFAGTTCGGTAIAEAGMFNSGGTGGELFARNTFGPVPALGATDTLTIGWNFTFTDT